jgi:hypothetical protein
MIPKSSIILKKDSLFLLQIKIYFLPQQSVERALQVCTTKIRTEIGCTSSATGKTHHRHWAVPLPSLKHEQL